MKEEQTRHRLRQLQTEERMNEMAALKEDCQRIPASANLIQSSN